MRKTYLLLLLVLVLPACAVSTPVTRFERSALSLSVVGLVNNSFPETASAHVMRPVSYGVQSGNVVDFGASTADAERVEADSLRFTTALASVGFDPEVAFNNSMRERLREIDIRTVDLNVERRRHPGLTRVRFEYLGEAPPTDAYLDVTFLHWGFVSHRGDTVLRPYFSFSVRLVSPSGGQVHMEETIQYGHDAFSGALVTTVIPGRPEMQFASLEELNANPERAAEYLNVAFDEVARQIAMRLQ